MPAQILDGRLTAKHWQTQLQQPLLQVRAPHLAVVLVGDHEPSKLYIARKQAACQSMGINFTLHSLDQNTTTSILLKLIDQLNRDISVDGILIQLPLPKQIASHAIIAAIDPHKDVDGFHPINLGRLVQKQPLIRSCTPLGIMYLLQHYQIPLSGKKAVVVGASTIVGRPLAFELINAGCTVTICHSKTQHLANEIKTAEILVSATGQRGLINSEWIKLDSVVIDVGIHRENQQIVGDLDFATAKLRAGWITPVPGGVGPMTVAALIHNTLQVAQR